MPTTLERRKHSSGKSGVTIHTSKGNISGIHSPKGKLDYVHTTKGDVDGVSTGGKDDRGVAQLVEARHGRRRSDEAADPAAMLLTIRAQMTELEKQLGVVSGGAPLPKVILPELHDKASGRLDAQKLASFMSVPLKALSEGLGLNYKAVHRNPSAPTIQEKLRPVKRVLEYLSEAFRKPETIRAWLNTPHPMLDDKSSLDSILAGKAFAVERLLGNAWDGVVS